MDLLFAVMVAEGGGEVLEVGGIAPQSVGRVLVQWAL
jgi:hypothetical protein